MSQRLFLIDGSSQMYRAYHAMRGGGLSGPGGRSTHAVYIFVTMLRKLIQDHNPQFIAASFDLPGPTFRSEMVTDYKANRAPMPSDLAEQIPWVHEACEALGVPILTYERFEADDVIGTLATQAVAAGFEVAIVTGDKDFFQLVHDGLKVYNPRDDGTWYDAEGVKEKFGVAPGQVVDVLALMGDSIDNIKGVPGIGEKGARDLIATYGNLDGLLAHAAEITNKRYREGLLGHADDAVQSRELARIRTDVPVEFHPEDLRYRGASRERCFELFTRLGFRTLVTEYAPDAQTIGKDYAVVRSIDELRQLASELRTAGRFGFRVLPDAPAAMRSGIAGLAFSLRPRHARYVPLTVRRPEADLFGPGNEGPAEHVLDVFDALAELKPLFEDASIAKVGHDLKFDAIVLERHGVALRGIDIDTMLASYLLDATRSAHPLEELSLEHAGYKALREEDVCGRGAKTIPFSQVPADKALDYAGERADLALQLADTLRGLLRKEHLERCLEDLERPLIPVLVAIEQAGVRIDGPALAAQSQHVDRELSTRSAQIFELAGEEFNINSPKQLSEILFDKLQLPALKRNAKTKTASTAFEVLEELALAHDLPRLILEWRALQKLKGTYIDALPQLLHPETGRVHTCFNQAVAATGRLSSSDPNLQNIPIRTELGREIRRAFIADDGHVLHLGGLLADRAAGAGAPVRRRGADPGVPRRRGHSRSDRAQGVRHRQRLERARAPPPREDHQLRAAVWEDGVHARQGHRRDPAGGAGLHQRLLCGLSGGARLHRRSARHRARHRRGQDDVRSPPARAGADQPQRSDSRRRRARRGQPADPGQRCRYPEARDDRRAPGAAVDCRRTHADDPDRPRRTAVRSPAGGGGREC